MSINEHMKWPQDKKRYDENHDKIFGGSEVCEKCGYLKPKDRVCIKCFEVEDEKHS